MHIAIQQPSVHSARIVQHPASLRTSSARATRIALPVSEGIRFVRYTSITCCTAESNYCQIHLVDGERILISKTLKWVTGQLPAGQFIRAHSSHLVNREYIELCTQDYLGLEGGKKVPIARSRRNEVRALLTS